MTDLATSRRMAAVGQRDTGPEMIVRRLLHSMEFRYRLHLRGLPGSPDIVFRSRKKVIFVHGCFWHRHGCKKATTPATNRAYWLPKFAANVRRDRRNVAALRRAGWKVLIVWECQTRDPSKLEARLRRFLEA